VTDRARTRRRWAVASLVAGLALFTAVGVAALGIPIVHGNETAAGQGDATTYLTDWQQTGSLLGAVPAPLPAVLSAVNTAPTLLPTANTAYLVAAGIIGHEAAEWTFTESPGIGKSLEIEIDLQIQASVGAVVTTHAYTLYVETPAVALGATYTFTVYWDAGAAAGVTLVSQFALSQACVAVGTCP
jgi:hypothetical protein